MTEIKQPKIRFKGYINDWEQCKFSNLLDKKDGIRRGPFGSALKKDFFVQHSEYVVYEQQNAIYDRFDTRYNITKEKYEELIKFKVESGDFIMSGAGTIGKISLVPNGIKQGVFNQALIRLRIDKNLIDSEYFLQLMRSGNIQKMLTNSNSGSAMVNLAPMSEVKNWNVVIPNKEEQSKIGEFFKTLDDTIALHQQKLEVTKQFKQTMLKKMFPKTGETTPEIRFKGFTGDWEECKLGDFLYEVSKRGNSDLEFITVREFDTILRPQSNQGYGNIVTDSKKLKAKIVLNGQFLIDLTSYSRGIYLSRLDGLTSNTYSVLELSEFGNLEFFTEFLKHPLFVSKLESLTPIGARQGKKIDQNSLLKSKFRMPHKEEQEVIGNYFKELDIQINSLEKKLFDMNLYKKTMLKKMFL